MGQSQMGFNQSSMPYGGGPAAHPGGIPPTGSMQNVPGPRFGGGVMPGASNSKVALQNMLRARHPGPNGGQYVGNPNGQMGMGMRPSGQYGANMVPGGQGMGGMRPSGPGKYGMQQGGMNQGMGM